MEELIKQLEAINKTLELILAKLPYLPAFPVQPTYPLPMAPQPWTPPFTPAAPPPQGPWVTCGSDFQTSSLLQGTLT